MLEFVHQAHAVRVVFGAGALQHLGREVERLGARRALVLCTPAQRALGERVGAALGERALGLCAQAAMHVPVQAAHAARQSAREFGADCTVAVGGGSTIGLAKAVALTSALPILAVPTTYAGSEMTPVYGLTEGGDHTTGRDPRVLPRTVLYDPQLTLTLPWPLTATSAINAIAHAAEGLYAHDAHPVPSLLAEEGIRALASALARLRTAPQDLVARADALYGAWLCAQVLGSVATGLHHQLCRELAASAALAHAPLHAVLLPHTLAYNAAHAPSAMARIQRALGTADAPGGVFDLAAQLGAPRSLRALGMPESGLDRAADAALLSPCPNPRPLERAGVRALLQRAFDGERPG
jgi:maleylacetate reductase